MNLAIVNDVPAIVALLKLVIEKHSNHSVIWTAADGREAVRMAGLDLPDLILMDLVMPTMDGVESTARIMQASPCAILLVTASIDHNAHMVFEAMTHGALDATTIPTLSGPTAKQEIENFLHKISIIERLISPHKSRSGNRPATESRNKNDEYPYPLVAIGSSTGGPGALAQILGQFPADFPSPIVIVQHVDKQFSADLANWLDSQCDLTVRLARSGDIPRAGNVLIAGGDKHLVMTRDGSLNYTEHPKELVHRPSVDVFFTSILQYWCNPIIGVLLTGMGRDGANGLLQIRKREMLTIAQDQESCAVFGMPKAAIALGAAEKILSLDVIADVILQEIYLPQGMNKGAVLK